MLPDVLIIGGGVIGLSIARDLHRAGVSRITIIEKGEIGREASYAAAGMLAPNVEAEKLDDFHRFCVESGDLFPKLSDELLEETGVDIELDRSGTLYLAFTESDQTELNKRFEWQHSAGINAERLSAKQTREFEPNISPDVRSTIYYPKDWQVENRKLLTALRKYAEIKGIEIVTQTEIEGLILDRHQILGAETGEKKYFAGTTILATGAWTSLIKTGETFLPVEVKPIRGQMISFRPAGRIFERVIYSPRGYVVTRADGRILVGATVEDAGFDKSVTDSGIDLLRTVALEIAPTLANFEVYDRWAGLRPAAPDKLPIIGSLSAFDGLVVATAHYRNGILLAPLTAKIVAEKLIGNGESKYLSLFSPERLIAARKVSVG